MSIIGEIIGIGTIVGIILTAVAKLIPNDKLHRIGLGIGNALETFGKARMGETWEKVEDVLVDSIGVFLDGVKVGLDPKEDSPMGEPKVEDSKKNVRT